MPEQERRACHDSRVETRKEGETEKIKLLAASFNSISEDLGGFKEIIRRGAFDATLRDVESGARDVSARIQHEGGMTTIGRASNGTLRLWTDDQGLWAEITPPDTQIGRDIITMIKGGYINKSSFAFSVRDNGDAWRGDMQPALRELLDVDLYDVAPVDGPAYQATSAQVREQMTTAFAEFRARVAAAMAARTPQQIKQEINERLNGVTLHI